MSGRLPYHVNQDNSAGWGWDSAAVHVAMKMLPEKLAEAGYYTVQCGKWHMGLARQVGIPINSLH
jgi:arylsulfatase A-like enzyme